MVGLGPSTLGFKLESRFQLGVPFWGSELMFPLGFDCSKATEKRNGAAEHEGVLDMPSGKCHPPPKAVG